MSIPKSDPIRPLTPYALLLSIFIVCCTGLCLGSEKHTEESEPQKSQSQTRETKSVIKKLGKFEIEKKHFVVIEDVTEREGNVLSYNSFEIKDEAGVSYYKEELELVPGYDTAIGGTFKLQGESGEGLIIFFDTWPTAPPSGKSFQIFKVEKSKVIPLSPPISIYGSIEQLPKGKTSEMLKLFDGDLVKVYVWKELIGVVVPLVVDFKKLTITPLRKDGVFETYLTATPERPRTSFGSPIKIYDDHNVNTKEDTIVPAKVKSVEFLNAYANVKLIRQRKDRMLHIDVSDLWLKVKINGKAGWVNDTNDFFTLGLIPF